MTKKVDEFFNLPPLEEALAEEASDDTADELEQEMEEITTDLTTVRRKGSLASLNDDLHDKETEEIRRKAIDLCDEIAEVARNVNPERSARLFEVAGQMLKTGLDASNSKADKQLKAAKLKLDARRLKLDDELVGEISHGREVIADRNELLRHLLKESKENVVDVEPNEEK